MDHNHRIIIQNNSKNGTNITIKKCNIITKNDNGLFTNANASYKLKMKNRILFSLSYQINNNTITNASLLSRQNLYHNIKYIYKNNDFSKPRVLFLKYNIVNNIEVSGLTLFDEIVPRNMFCNFYKNYKNSDYYKFLFSDFLTNPIEIKNIDISNYFSGNNSINYDVNNFTTFIYDLSNNLDNIDDTLLSNLNYFDMSNINKPIDYNDYQTLIYNQLNNLTTLTVKVDATTDISINFFIKKSFDPFNDYGKIYLYKDDIILNCNVISESTQINQLHINNKITDPSKIYLSLGDCLTGLTQQNIMNKILPELVFTENNNYIKKLTFSNDISNANNLNVFNNTYLLDSSYNYDYTNIIYYNIKKSTSKLISDNLENFYYNFNNTNTNIYANALNTLEVLNNGLQNNYFDTYYNKNNIEFAINNALDISYDNETYKLSLNNKDRDDIYNNALNYNDINNILQYDFRYNYATTFEAEIYLTIRYKDLSLNNINLKNSKLNLFSNNNSSLLLNFNKIQLLVNFEASAGSDFTNVDCIFIYHSPNTTDLSYLYPYSNIQILNDPNIDSLSKAIVNLPGLATSTTNYTFIPAKNGSNLSRKQIQGLIGLNDIPRLLSIKPYDPKFIDGRGFVNQFQQDIDTCLDYEGKVKVKLNSQKHDSVKERLNFLSTSNRKQNFANLVRSNARNRGIKSFNTNNRACTDVDPASITNYKTIFKIKNWNKSNITNGNNI
jgi:hypothetical protein